MNIPWVQCALMKHLNRVCLSGLLSLAACQTAPTGPKVMALPGTTRDYVGFQADDLTCRETARQQTGGETPADAATATTVTGSLVGASLGAATGAAISGGDGASTGAGAGVGLLGGTLIGSAKANPSATAVQAAYDQAYVQCMYGHGHQVPVAAHPITAAHNQPAPIALDRSLPLPPRSEATEEPLALPPRGSKAVTR